LVLDRHDLTDEEWARLEPLLPDQTRRRGGRWADQRGVLADPVWCGLA
jgi:transposase